MDPGFGNISATEGLAALGDNAAGGGGCKHPTYSRALPETLLCLAQLCYIPAGMRLVTLLLLLSLDLQAKWGAEGGASPQPHRASTTHPPSATVATHHNIAGLAAQVPSIPWKMKTML